MFTKFDEQSEEKLKKIVVYISSVVYYKFYKYVIWDG